MRRFGALCIVVAIACVCPPAIRASVVVTSIFNLTQLQILPGSGTVVFTPPVTATTFASAQDSLGGADANFDSQDNGTSTAAALTMLASATASADASALTAGASSFINIPGSVAASASSSAQGTLLGSFQIVGATGPVSVDFLATLVGSQTLSTDSFGVLATSEIIFNLLLPDLPNQPLLFADSSLQIGSNQFLFQAYNNTLSNSVLLDPNTTYFLYAQVDSESFGLNTPEPSALLLTALGLSVVFLRRRRAF